MDKVFYLVLLTTLIISQVTGQDIGAFIENIRAQGISVSQVPFSNWGGTVSKGSIYKISPYDKNEVKNIVSTAYDYQVRVRATGSTHSFSDLFADTNQVWLDMSGYRRNEPDRIYLISPTFVRTFPQVTLNPSVTMGDFAAFMGENGVSLPSYPAVLSPSPMGLTSTGAHGFNWHDGPISSHLVNVQFVNGEGESRVFDFEQNGDAFNVFRLHLGLCGVITEMTFRVTGWQLMKKYTDVRITFNDLFYNVTALQLLLEESHSWLATWDIFSSLTDQEKVDMITNGGVTDSWVPADDFAQFAVVQEMDGGTSEILDAATNRTVFAENFTLGGEFYSDAQMVYGYLPNLGDLDPVEENSNPIHSEFAFSVNENNFLQVGQVLEILFEEMFTYARSHTTVPLTSVQFGFFRHNSSCILCHTNVADSSVNSHSHSDLIFMVNFVLESQHLTEFNSLIATLYASWKAANLQGLPHFGKYIPEVTAITDDIISKMGDKINTFRTLREEASLDNIDLFTNNFIDSIIFHDKTRNFLDSGGTGGHGNRIQASLTLILLFVFGTLLLVNGRVSF